MDPDYLPFHPNPSKPVFTPPQSAADAHCHVFGPGDIFPALSEESEWASESDDAGHDACNLALKAPTGMIFVPCEDGISHNEAENAKPEDLAAGANVLLHVMLAWAE